MTRRPSDDADVEPGPRRGPSPLVPTERESISVRPSPPGEAFPVAVVAGIPSHLRRACHLSPLQTVSDLGVRRDVPARAWTVLGLDFDLPSTVLPQLLR